MVLLVSGELNKMVPVLLNCNMPAGGTIDKFSETVSWPPPAKVTPVALPRFSTRKSLTTIPESKIMV